MEADLHGFTAQKNEGEWAGLRGFERRVPNLAGNLKFEISDFKRADSKPESVDFRCGYWQNVLMGEMDSASVGLAIDDCEKRGIAR